MNESLLFFLELDDTSGEVKTQTGKEDPKLYDNPILVKVTNLLNRVLYPNLTKVKNLTIKNIRNTSYIRSFYIGINLIYNLYAVLDKLSSTDDQDKKNHLINELRPVFIYLSKIDQTLSLVSEKYGTKHFKT